MKFREEESFDPMTRLAVLTASARMPMSCKGRYGKVALVRLTPEFALEGKRPTMISERAEGIEEVLYVEDRLHRGYNSAGNTAFDKALREAKAELGGSLLVTIS